MEEGESDSSAITSKPEFFSLIIIPVAISPAPLTTTRFLLIEDSEASEMTESLQIIISLFKILKHFA